MPKGIPKLYTYLIEKHAHLVPQIHVTLCSPACVYYADCANYEQNQPCVGFKLAENEENVTRQILANLNENDRIFVEKCLQDIPKIQDEQYKEILVKEVLRYIEPEKSEKTFKKVVRIYDGNLVYSEKTEELKSLEETQTKQVSLFNENWQIPSENVRKPPKPEPPPKIETEEGITMNIREHLNKNVFSKPQERILQTKFPEICMEQCEFLRQCPYGNRRNFGKPCVKRQELYQNR
jgi:hypothetical protein